MSDGGNARVLLFPDRRSELMMSSDAPTPEVGDVLKRNGDEWVVVEVTEDPRGSTVRLEPVERADEQSPSLLTPLSHSASSPVYLAGLRIPSEDVRKLAARVDEPTRTVLENALDRDTIIVGLSIVDREMILEALDDPQTDALSELREALLSEHQWRTREGLV
jgi:hypothetical protein